MTDQQGVIPSEELLVIGHEGGIVEVRLNRPEKRNALTDDMYHQLTEIFRGLHEKPEIRAVLVSGSGQGFCSGSEVGGMLKVAGAAARRRLQRRHAAIQAVSRLEKPVIAAVRGPVAGIGFSLAAACDLVVASETTYFQQSFRNVGLIPDGGAIHFLNQRLGISRAKDLVMTGRKLPAREAYDWGLVNRLVPDDQLEEEAMALATELASAPTYVLGLTKKLFVAANPASLDSVFEIESFAASVARSSADHREGVTAFREKRKPRFTGE